MQSNQDTAIYARQSRDRNSSYTSCDAQLRICRDLADSRGFAIRDEYSDEVESGETLSRPQMKRLLAAIDDGHLKRLIVYSIDRLTRRLSDLQELMERFNRNGVQLVIVTDSQFSDSAAGRLMTNIVGAASEFQLDLTRERMADARAALKRQGKRVAGRVPFGYQAVKASKTLAVHPEQGLIVKEFFSLASQGKKPSELARLANSSLWKNHHNETGKWTPRWITKLLSNRAYIGEIRYGKSWLPGDHGPIVSQAVFDIVQNQLAQRRLRGNSRRKSGPSRFDFFQLKGLLYCGQCLRPMSTSVSIRGSIRYRYFRCRSHAGGRPPCPGVNIGWYDIHRLISSVLLEADDLELIASKFPEYWGGLDETTRLHRLVDLVERILFHFHVGELTIQFKDDLASIIDKLSSKALDGGADT